MPTPVARLTQAFVERMETTGLSDTALAAAIGVSKQYFSQVRTGAESPSVRFIVGAIQAGLASDFAEVAELNRGPESSAA